jgi:signal transduction histidine kinase
MSRLRPKLRFQNLFRLGFCWWSLNFLLPVFFSMAGLAAVESSTNSGTALISEATNRLGVWIWNSKTLDKQSVRLWKSFEIPRITKVSKAQLFITVDNGYSLFLDGREIGRGSDWRTLTEYDVTRLLNPGQHIVCVEGFNERLEAGLIFGLHIELADKSAINIVSDKTWSVVPNELKDWAGKKNAPPGWAHSIVVGSIHQHPWEAWPFFISTGPPLEPVLVHFWQRGWFQLSLVSVCMLALSFCIWLMTQLAAQSKAQRFLQVERARIARDIHDDLGAQLTQLVLFGEVAQSELPPDSATRMQFNQICERARDISRAMGEIVWAINSRRDTVRDFVTYVCKYAQLFLAATPIRCRLDVEPEIPEISFDLPVRRNLFLAVKEALNNAAKHSGAAELFLRIYRKGQTLMVAVEDNGRGFDSTQTGAAGNGMSNMFQRMQEIGGGCNVSSQPGGGCLIVFTVPLDRAQRRTWFNGRRRPRDEIEDSNSDVRMADSANSQN